MFANAFIQVGLFSILVTVISVPLGLYMARVFSGQRTFLDLARSAGKFQRLYSRQDPRRLRASIAQGPVASQEIIKWTCPGLMDTPKSAKVARKE